MAEAPLDTPLFRSDLLEIATFRVRPDDPRFSDTGPIGGYLFVFPRNSVRILPARSEPVVADANTVMFYNRHQEYRRDVVHREGDHCVWFSLPAPVVVDAVSRYEPAVRDDPERPYPFRWAPCPRDVYLAQRALTGALERGGLAADPLEVEETVLDLLGRTLDQLFRGRSRRRTGSSRGERQRIELAEAARALLGQRFTEPLTLADLAGHLETSVFHLSRVFRARTGASIHQYLTDLRVRAALDWIGEPGISLTDLALDLGFSSHSHFTERFRRAFGAPPSEMRRTLGGR